MVFQKIGTIINRHNLSPIQVHPEKVTLAKHNYNISDVNNYLVLENAYKSVVFLVKSKIVVLQCQINKVFSLRSAAF